MEIVGQPSDMTSLGGTASNEANDLARAEGVTPIRALSWLLGLIEAD